MHIQITKTLDKAFGFAPKQQQVIIILTRAGHQPNSKPPVKKNKNQPITNNLNQTAIGGFIKLNQAEVFLVQTGR